MSQQFRSEPSPNEREELFGVPELPPWLNLENFEHWLIVCAGEEFLVLLFHGMLFVFSPMAPNRMHKQGGVDIRQLNANAGHAQALMAQAQAMGAR
jgi:hypothetical protein